MTDDYQIHFLNIQIINKKMFAFKKHMKHKIELFILSSVVWKIPGVTGHTVIETWAISPSLCMKHFRWCIAHFLPTLLPVTVFITCLVFIHLITHYSPWQALSCTIIFFLPFATIYQWQKFSKHTVSWVLITQFAFQTFAVYSGVLTLKIKKKYNPNI